MAPWRCQGAESGEEWALTFGVGMAILSLISRGTPTGHEEEGVRVDSSPEHRGKGSSLPAEPGERFGSSPVCDG